MNDSHDGDKREQTKYERIPASRIAKIWNAKEKSTDRNNLN